MCLPSRSVHQFTRINSDADSEDIEILDYDRKRSVFKEEGRHMTINGKNKKRTTQKSDTESKRDNEKHIECVHKVSKSEVKMQKTRNNKRGRKTTHGTSHIDGNMDVNVKKGNRKKKIAVNSDINNVDDNCSIHIDDDVNDLESNKDSDNINDMENNMNNKDNSISKLEESVDSRKRKGMNLLNKAKNVKKTTEINVRKKHQEIEKQNVTEFNNSKKLEYFENTERNINGGNEIVPADDSKNHTKKTSKKEKKGKNLAIEIVDTADCVEVEYKGKRNKTEQKEIKRKSSSDEHHSPKLNFHNDSNHDNNVNAEDDKVVSDEGNKKAKKSSKKKLKMISDDEHSVITYKKTENKLRETSKRKSSSEDNLEDNVEIETNTSKSKKLKIVKKSRRKETMRGRRGKCSSSSSSDHDVFTVDRVERSANTAALEEYVGDTPFAHSIYSGKQHNWNNI